MLNMEPIKIKLKRKYTNEKRVKQNKSVGGNAGKSKNKIVSKVKQAHKPRVMYVNGATGHTVMKVVEA